MRTHQCSFNGNSRLASRFTLDRFRVFNGNGRIIPALNPSSTPTKSEFWARGEALGAITIRLSVESAKSRPTLNLDANPNPRCQHAPAPHTIRHRRCDVGGVYPSDDNLRVATPRAACAAKPFLH